MTKRSGLADSPLFLPSEQPEQPEVTPDQKATDSGRLPDSRVTVESSDDDTTTSRHHDTVVSRHHDTEVSSRQESDKPDPPSSDEQPLAIPVETIRKAVKEIGKEAATHRFTPDEKEAIAKVIFDYKMAGIKTSENEITRIAVNYLLLEYEQAGDSSILAQVIDSLYS